MLTYADETLINMQPKTRAAGSLLAKLQRTEESQVLHLYAALNSHCMQP